VCKCVHYYENVYGTKVHQKKKIKIKTHMHMGSRLFIAKTTVLSSLGHRLHTLTALIIIIIIIKLLCIYLNFFVFTRVKKVIIIIITDDKG